MKRKHAIADELTESVSLFAIFHQALSTKGAAQVRLEAALVHATCALLLSLLLLAIPIS